MTGIGQQKKAFAILILILIAGVLAGIYYVWIKPPLHQLIERVIHKQDPSYQEIIHIQSLKDKLLVYYKTNKEVAALLLEENMLGYKIAEYLGKHSLHPDKAISWQGNMRSQENIYLLHGIVYDPQVTQVILVSEKSKSATIIDSGSTRIWFSFLENHIQNPITIRATDKTGKALFEGGLMEYWGERKQLSVTN